MKKGFIIVISLLCALISMGAKAKKTSWDTTREFGKEIAKEHHLKLLNEGYGSLIDSKVCQWSLSFTDSRKMTLDEGIELVAPVVQAFKEKLFKDPIFENWRLERTKEGFKGIPEKLDEELIGFKIAFWDENVDRPLHPYLSQIRLIEKNVNFYYADPKTQALKDPVVLSMEEVIKKAQEIRGRKE